MVRLKSHKKMEIRQRFEPFRSDNRFLGPVIGFITKPVCSFKKSCIEQSEVALKAILNVHKA